jgi:hypothetical protein
MTEQSIPQKKSPAKHLAGDFNVVEMAGIDTQPSVFQPSVDYLFKWLYHSRNHLPGVL